MAEKGNRWKSTVEFPQKHEWSRRYLYLWIVAHLFSIKPCFTLALDKYFRHPIYLARYQVECKRLLVQSRDKGRMIKVDVYTPNKGISKPSPIHINWHGCAFICPIFGIDAKICSYIASKLGCIVFDADYRKTPQHPFPASPQDALDVCYYVLAHPELYDAKRISLGGSSSGGNLALGAAASLGSERICAVCTNSPPTYMAIATKDRVAKDPGCHPYALPTWLLDFTFECAIRKETDLTDPLLSPFYASTSSFPNVVSIWTGTGDTLYHDGRKFIDKLISEGHPNARFIPLEGLGHAFEPKRSLYVILNDLVTTIQSSWNLSSRVNKL